MAEYLQKGESLDYTNTTDELIPHGTVVVIGERIGVTGCPIPPGGTGSLHVTGVFEIDKTGTTQIKMGQTVYFDGEGITDAESDGASSAYVKAGYAAAPSAAEDKKVLVKICG